MLKKNEIIPQNSTKLTTAQKRRRFIEIYAKKLNISLACEDVGIDRGTYYNWVKRFPNFKKDMDERAEAVTDLVETKLISEISKGNARLIEFYLKNKARNRGYADAPIENQTNVQVNVIQKDTEAIIKRLLERKVVDIK